MQQDRFTIKSQEAVAAAQRLASEHSNPEVAPAHLLAALLEQEDGVVVPVLQRLGEDIEAVRARVREAVENLPRLSGNTVPDIRPSKEFVWVIQQAEKEATGSRTSTSPPSISSSRWRTRNPESPTCFPSEASS